MGTSKRKEEKEIKRNIKERKIKKRAKFLGRLEDLTKQPKKDINRGHLLAHLWRSSVSLACALLLLV